MHARPAWSMRYFTRLSEREPAVALGISLSTLKRDWDFAKAWMFDLPGLDSWRSPSLLAADVAASARPPGRRRAESPFRDAGTGSRQTAATGNLRPDPGRDRGSTVGYFSVADLAMLTRFRLVVFAVLAAGIVLAAGPRTWKADGVTFELTPSELRAWTGAVTGPPAFSTAALLASEKREFDDYAKELARGLEGPGAPQYGVYTFDQSVTFDVLSIVGPLVSMRESGGGYAPGAARPSGYHVLRVHDVLRRGATPSLLEYFSEKQLVAALKADPFVRKFGNPEKGFARAASLEELVAALDPDWARENSDDPGGDCGFEVSFDASMVRQFYFHHVEKNRVAVRIALAPGNEWCNRTGGRIELDLLLPIPQALSDQFLRAGRGEAGFLAGNRQAAGSPSYSDHWEVDIRTLVRKR